MSTETERFAAAPDRRHYGDGVRRPGPAGPAERPAVLVPRLLAGWYETGRATGLEEHLRRYGPPPVGPDRRRQAPLLDAAERSGLTGRGGAGFPTGRKLRAVAAAGAPAVVVANGMESEPLSAKDRTLLSLAPHLVLDGMALTAAALGARQAHLCVPRGQGRLAGALREAAELRWRHRLDPVFVQVHELPHHYVSSEASALARWLNGGEARPRPGTARLARRGVDGLPTLVDNVEPRAQLALIARYGPDWFRRAGEPDAPGTALVTLCGAVARPGVYEVALGVPLRSVLELGGVSAPPRAVLAGGFFGGWVPDGAIPALRWSESSLATVGAGAGAGVLAVLPEGACGLAETARILRFLGGQSAGQCGPCRFGLPATADDFAELAWGRVDRAGMQRLERHVALLPGRGACKHPDGAARLAASALRAFAAEVRAHLRSGPCPAAWEGGGVLGVPDREPVAGDWR